MANNNSTQQQDSQYQQAPIPQDMNQQQAPIPQDMNQQQAPIPQDMNQQQAPIPQDMNQQQAPVPQDMNQQQAPVPQDMNQQQAPVPQDMNQQQAPIPKDMNQQQAPIPQDMNQQQAPIPQDMNQQQAPIPQDMNQQQAPIPQDMNQQQDPVQYSNNRQQQNNIIENKAEATSSNFTHFFKTIYTYIVSNKMLTLLFTILSAIGLSILSITMLFYYEAQYNTQPGNTILCTEETKQFILNLDKSQSKNITGFLTDLFNSWKQTTNINIQFVPISTQHTMLYNLTPSMSIQLTNNLPDTTTNRMYSLPFLYTGHMMISLNKEYGSPTNSQNNNVIIGISSACSQDVIDELRKEEHISIIYQDITTLLDSLLNNQVDYIAIPMSIHDKVSTYPQLASRTYFETPICIQFFRIAFHSMSPNHDLLKHAFDEYIEHICKSGFLFFLMEKWELEYLYPSLKTAIIDLVTPDEDTSYD